MSIACGHHEICGICHTSDACEHMVDRLAELLNEADAQVTFDAGRDNTHPCTFCARIPERFGVSAHELITIGAYLDGSSLTRPVCPACKLSRAHRWQP